MKTSSGLTLVKWGGSLITDKAQPFTARPAVIERLVRELAQCWAEAQGRLVLGHGSGSFGHVAADEHQLQHGYTSPRQLSGIHQTQRAAARLHEMVLETLGAAGLPAFSVAPSSAFITRDGTPAHVFAEPVRRALHLGLLPVVYGDVTLDRAQGVAIASTEAVFRGLIRALQVEDVRTDRVLWLGRTEGIYDADGQTIARVDPQDADAVGEQLGEAAGTDVTGGMQLRLQTALDLGDNGVSSLILNGETPGAMVRALRGEAVAGTRIDRDGET